MSFTSPTGRRLLPMQSAASIKPLKTIIYSYNLEQIKALVKSNFPIFVRDEFGNSGLHYAVSQAKKQVAVLLIAKDPKMAISKNNDGETPLHCLKKDNPAIARMIVDRDEKVLFKKDNIGRTPIQVMIAQGTHKAASELLMDLSNKSSLKKFEFLCMVLPEDLVCKIFKFYRPAIEEFSEYINIEDLSGRILMDRIIEQSDQKLKTIIKGLLNQETPHPYSRKRKKLSKNTTSLKSHPDFDSLTP